MTLLLTASAALSTAALALAPTSNIGDETAVSKDPLAEEPSEEGSGIESPFLESIKTLVKSEDMEIKWGGRIQFDMVFIDEDRNYPGDGDDFTEFRRARLYAEGKLYDAVDFKAEYDFAGEENNMTDFNDVWIGIQTSVGKVQAGHFKQPFGLEEMTSANYITFLERSLVDEALTPVRDSGIMMADLIGDNTNWALGVFRRTNDIGFDSGDGDYAVTGRLAHAFPGDDGDVLHLGLAASERAGLSDERFRTRPEFHQSTRVVDTNVLMTDDASLYGAEVAWVHGPLSIQGEYMMASLDSATDGVFAPTDIDLSGFYAFVSWFLTGESRAYKVKGAKFDRLKPQENYTGSGLGGAWEVALRYSTVDFDDGPLMQDADNFTAGLNWYLNPNARIQFNVVQSTVEDDAALLDEDATAFMVRWQVDW